MFYTVNVLLVLFSIFNHRYTYDIGSIYLRRKKKQVFRWLFCSFCLIYLTEEGLIDRLRREIYN
jgi:hypothetical protein